MREDDDMWNDPDNWKGGLFYFNPKDKRVFVLKRNPWFGITLNFGNPYSIIPIALLLILVIFSSKK
ncbi:MAG TPA: DUF5808 domain-containing protein [Bacteroidia bacterium]|jgi:uncharacterized membrane protein|nr:DUF5808 domain-containing protein [Bacteroidia bacterium]